MFVQYQFMRRLFLCYVYMVSPTPRSQTLALSNRQLLIPRRRTDPLQHHSNVRPNIRNLIQESRNRGKEVSKQHEYPIQLDHKPNEGPSQQYQGNTGDERDSAFELLSPSEEGERLLDPDDQRETDEEEDVAHCEHGAVEEEKDAAEEEEAAA